jgi:Mn-dependent DtxR family transcriptional regulator
MVSRISQIIEPKLLKIIKLFLEKETEIFHLLQISKEAKVPLGTTFRLINKLKKIGLVDTITIGKSKLYRTNIDAAHDFKMLLKK